MKKPWQVKYQTILMRKPLVRRFTTEIQARRFYKKTWKLPFFQSAAIVHLGAQTASVIVCRVMDAILERRDFKRLWTRLPEKEKIRILRTQNQSVRKVLEEFKWTK